MAKLNVPVKPDQTYEGAPASRTSNYNMLRRSVCSCMLWEDEFYEDGESIVDRICSLVPTINDPTKVLDLAIEVRERFKLRHVPLLLVREACRIKGIPIANTLERIVQRPDELTEFLAIYWKNGRQPLSAQVKKGLARAFTKFNAYQLAKYNREGAVKLRDVLFLCHAKPKNSMQEALWKQLIDDTLQSPDTWEVALSAGADKRETWERLLSENKLGTLALLRNLRNMVRANVPETLIEEALGKAKIDKVLPFRFLSAAKATPQLEDVLEPLMFKALEGKNKLLGKTALLVDGSGSMFGTNVSKRSDLTRFDAACALAVLVREVCESCNIYIFSYDCYQLSPRRGFALKDLLDQTAESGGTNIQTALDVVASDGYDRIVVITDEQSHQRVSGPLEGSNAYMINVASYKNGVGYGKWNHIDGFSEAVLDWIYEYEQLGEIE